MVSCLLPTASAISLTELAHCDGESPSTTSSRHASRRGRGPRLEKQLAPGFLDMARVRQRVWQFVHAHESAPGVDGLDVVDLTARTSARTTAPSVTVQDLPA